MADGFKIEIKGVKELQSKFKNIGDELQKALSEAVSAGAVVVERDAKIRVPVVTGNLRNSIKEFKKIESSGNVESQVGSDMKYAARVEFGFSDTDSRGRTYHQASKPYLRPALDENRTQIQAAFDAKIKQVLGRYK